MVWRDACSTRRRSQVVDPHGGVRGDVHAADRHHHRQRRAARHRQGAALVVHRPAMGHRRLRADARRVPADLGRDCPTASGGATSSSSAWRSSPSPRWLCGLSTSPIVLNLARAAAGRRRRGDVRHLAGAAGRGLPRPRARHRGRDLGRDHRRAPSPSARSSAALLTETIGWESIFYINVPIGIAAIYIALTRVAESKRPRRRRRSTGSASSPSRAALFLLIFALVRGNAEGWGSTLIVSLPHRRRRPARRLRASSRPASRTRCSTSTLFRKPTFGGASIAAFALSASMFSMFLYLTLYMQNGLGLLAAARPACASCRSRCCRSSWRRWPGRLSARVPIRALIGGGMLLVAHRPAAHARPVGRLGVDRPAGRLHRGRASGSRSSTRRSRRPPSASSRRSARAWARGSTRRSARWASRPAPPALGALFQHIAGQQRDRARWRACPPRSWRRAVRPCAAPAAHEAYLTLFTGALNDILLVAAIVAFAGAVLSFVLIRGSDFVASEGAAAAAAEPSWPPPARRRPTACRRRATSAARDRAGASLPSSVR